MPQVSPKTPSPRNIRPHLTPKIQTNLSDWTNPYRPYDFDKNDTDSDSWGDILTNPTQNIFRIIAGNINGFSLDKSANSKLNEILTNLQSLQTSAFLFQEINTDF